MSKDSSTCQYTVRNVPRRVDAALRRRAKALGKSLNEVAVEALTRGADEETPNHDDLDFLVGSLSAAEARALDRAIAEQRTTDGRIWR